MKQFRLLLLPFAWIYGIITWIRNILYDAGILKSYEIPGKSICVGNLSIGGTGKTPHVDYIVSHLLSIGVSVSILSRGYGRKTKGFLEVVSSSVSSDVGDEPLFYKSRYGNKVNVFVCEKRETGIKNIRKEHPNDIIILDDAFQHRAVKAGLNILITPYNDLFVNDHHLPAGNLREWPIGKKRAQIVVVSKCPELKVDQKSKIVQKLNFCGNKVYFSSITYEDLIGPTTLPNGIKNILVVTGIANPEPLLNRLNSEYNVVHQKYRDHHIFTGNDLAEIHEKFDTFASSDKIIVTTEKDFMRIKDFPEVNTEERQWFYQPIRTIIDKEEDFNGLLDEYVR